MFKPCISAPSSTITRLRAPKIFNPLPTCDEEWDYFKQNPSLDLVDVIQGFQIDEVEVLQLSNGILLELLDYDLNGVDLLSGQIHPNTYFYKLYQVSHINHKCS